MKSAPEISPREAAVRLGIRLDVLYPLLRIGRLRARKEDGRWLVSAKDVAERARNRTGPEAKSVSRSGSLR
jgi:predicted site-specific integrase-resolvase